MPYGFEVRDSNNQVVLDANSIVPAMREPINFTTDSGGFINFESKTGLYFIPLPNQRMITNCLPNPGQNRVRIRSGTGSLPPVLANTVINTRRVTSFNETAITPGYGMAVFNADGEATFHTGSPLLSVKSVKREILFSNQTSKDVTIPSSSTHFFVRAGWRQLLAGANSTIIVTLGLQRINATTVRIIPDQFGQFPLPRPSDGPIENAPITIVAVSIV
jgi:hypothetical protein